MRYLSTLSYCMGLGCLFYIVNRDNEQNEKDYHQSNNGNGSTFTYCLFKLSPNKQRDIEQRYPENETLKEVDSDSLEKGVQWVSDAVQPHYYTSLIVPKVELEQNKTHSKQIPETVLKKLSTVVTKQLRSNISSDIKVVDKVGPHVAQINLRISRATANPEDLKLTEVIPIGAVIGAVKMALGTRDQSVRIIIEAQIVDSISNKPLAERVSVIEAAGVLEI
ncbi:DUF3313 domain-containing protein [Photobacterium profundum]|uniref:DUF3313 domain-containing protein n=1 Tax=Photobacterium profundum TaxID=74109 RepID=UPI003D13E19B